jgi:cardiolipin synthase
MKEQTACSNTYLVTVFLFTFLFLFAFALTLIPEAAAQSSPENTAPPPLLITELYPNTATRNELDEYVALSNPSTLSVNIEGWSITDNEGTIIFPTFEVGSNQTVYVTRNASAFLTQQSSVKREVSKPDFEYGSDSDPAVSQLQTEGRTFALRNSGDEVILRDASGKEVDVVLFGEAAYEGSGWRAELLEKPREGMIFIRKGVQDTNQCGDWLILPFGASYHAPVKFPCAGSRSATTFVSPDCSFPVLQEELNNAASTLYINLYEFDNPYLMDSIVDALERGVNVKVLLEGSPVGGITDEEWYIAGTIAERGGEVRLSTDPFINHAKYAVLDNRTLIVMTENWKTTGSYQQLVWKPWLGHRAKRRRSGELLHSRIL